MYLLPAVCPRPSIRAVNTPGKADPVWDTGFRAKFSKPAEPKMVEARGYTSVITQFEDRAREIWELTRTQHLELSPIAAQLAANGHSVVRLDGVDDAEYDMSAANIASDHLRVVPLDPDPLTIAATTRLIEWEKFKTSCGPVCRTRWVVTDRGTVGIEYLGDRWNVPEYALAQKRAFKYDRNHGVVPSVAEIEERAAFLDYYNQRPGLAYMSESDYDAFIRSKTDDGEDPMDAVHAEWLYEDVVGVHSDTTYAGPKGQLNLDDDGVDDEEDLFEPIQRWRTPTE